MKRSLSIFAAALLAAITFTATYIHLQHGRVWCNSESTGFLLTKGGYRSWQIYYSYGRSLRADGSLKHHWHRPQFNHKDLRNIIMIDGHHINYGTNNIIFVPYGYIGTTNLIFIP